MNVTQSTFRLPKTPEAEIIKRYRLPHTTKLLRNLMLRDLRRSINPRTGERFQAREIMAMPYFQDIRNEQTIYHIEKSAAYKQIEDDLKSGHLA